MNRKKMKIKRRLLVPHDFPVIPIVKGKVVIDPTLLNKLKKSIHDAFSLEKPSSPEFTEKGIQNQLNNLKSDLSK